MHIHKKKGAHRKGNIHKKAKVNIDVPENINEQNNVFSLTYANVGMLLYQNVSKDIQKQKGKHVTHTSNVKRDSMKRDSVKHDSIKQHSIKQHNIKHEITEQNTIEQIQEKQTHSQSTPTYSEPDMLNVSTKSSHKMNAVKLHTKSYIWILYVMIFGYDEYELIDTELYFKTEQTFRFDLIKRIQKLSSDKLNYAKAHKIKVPLIMNELGNDSNISVASFIGLCMLLHMNICMVKHKVAQICNYNLNEEELFFILDVNKTILHVDKQTKQMCEETYYLVENIHKPFKAFSSYSAPDLRHICAQLDISTKTEKNTNKTKKVLYQELIDKIEI